MLWLLKVFSALSAASDKEEGCRIGDLFWITASHTFHVTEVDALHG